MTLRRYRIITRNMSRNNSARYPQNSRQSPDLHNHKRSTTLHYNHGLGCNIVPTLAISSTRVLQLIYHPLPVSQSHPSTLFTRPQHAGRTRTGPCPPSDTGPRPAVASWWPRPFGPDEPSPSRRPQGGKSTSPARGHVLRAPGDRWNAMVHAVCQTSREGAATTPWFVWATRRFQPTNAHDDRNASGVVTPGSVDAGI